MNISNKVLRFKHVTVKLQKLSALQTVVSVSDDCSVLNKEAIFGRRHVGNYSTTGLDSALKVQ